jgi:hypothetical protein
MFQSMFEIFMTVWVGSISILIILMTIIFIVRVVRSIKTGDDL